MHTYPLQLSFYIHTILLEKKDGAEDDNIRAKKVHRCAEMLQATE